MPDVSVTRGAHHLTVRTAEIELVFSLDDGSLCALRQRGGPNLVGHGVPLPVIDVQVGFDSAWLAERVFVRFLRHEVRQQYDAVEIDIVIGIGPLMISDRYRITGTLIARSALVRNTSEDTIRFDGLRLIIPWVRPGELESCRFESPGNATRPHIPLHIAAGHRRSVPVRRFVAPSLHFDRMIEATPQAGHGLIGVYDTLSNETLLCWYDSMISSAEVFIEGNDGAVSLNYQVHTSAQLQQDAEIWFGTQYLLLLRESWSDALASYRRTRLLFQHPPAERSHWLEEAALYEIHAAQASGFAGLADRLPELQHYGITTVCLLPVWLFAQPEGSMWDENWQDGGNPYALLSFEQIDPTLGSEQDLKDFVAYAHQLGMRILIDLPMIGCDPNSEYLPEHPDWFSYNETNTFSDCADFPGLICFDWTNTELQRFWCDRATEQAMAWGIDGFRAITSSCQIYNWHQSAPYQAGTSALNITQVLFNIRNQLRTWRGDTVLLTSLLGPAAVRCSDAVVDELTHAFLMHLVLGRVPPAEFGQWLQDAAELDSQALPRITHTESYRTWLTDSLADGLRGSLLTRMALAGLVFCGFVPLLRYGQEECDRDYIQQLLAARRSNPVLRQGMVSYNAVPCNDPQVFLVLRTLGDTSMLGVLKCGSRKHKATISLPLDMLGLEDGWYGLYDVLRQEWIGEGQRSAWRRDELLSFQLTFEPFEAYGLLIRPVAEPHILAPRKTLFTRAIARQ